MKKLDAGRSGPSFRLARVSLGLAMVLVLTGCTPQPNAAANGTQLPKLPSLVSQTPSPRPTANGGVLANGGGGLNGNGGGGLDANGGVLANGGGGLDANQASNVLGGAALDAFRKQEQQGYAAGLAGNYNPFYDEHDAAMDALGKVTPKPEAGLETQQDVPLSWNGVPQPWRAGLANMHADAAPAQAPEQQLGDQQQSGLADYIASQKDVDPCDLGCGEG